MGKKKGKKKKHKAVRPAAKPRPAERKPVVEQKKKPPVKKPVGRTYFDNLIKRMGLDKE